MKKYGKICLLVSTIILSTSLMACGANGQKGDTGDKGEQGIPGQKGDTGDKGDKGEKGDSGTSILTGTSNPNDSIGNEGDIYINTSSYDLFKKVDGKWTLIGNIKGAKGDDGSKGEEITSPTTYGVSITQAAHGTISVNKPSAIVGTAITFTFIAESGYYMSAMSINNTSRLSAITTSSTNNLVSTYTTSMVENGLIVSATFSEGNPIKVTTAAELEAAINSADPSDIIVLTPTSDPGDFTQVTIDKEVTVSILGKASGLPVDLSGLNIVTQCTIELEDNKAYKGIVKAYPTTTEKVVTINGNGGSLDGIIASNDKTPLVIKNLTITNNNNYVITSTRENSFNGISAFDVESDSLEALVKNSAIVLGKESSVTLSNVIINGDFNCAIYGYYETPSTDTLNNLTIKDSTIYAGLYKGIYLNNPGDIDIEDSTFYGNKLDYGTNTLTTTQKSNVALVDLDQINVNGGDVLIKRNNFKNVNTSGDKIAALTIKTSNTGKFTSVKVTDNVFTDNTKDIILGVIDDSNSMNFGEEANVDIQRDCNIYDNTGSGTLASFIFANGQLYGYTTDDTNTKILLSEVKFSGGNGSASSPLLINSVEEFNMITLITNGKYKLVSFKTDGTVNNVLYYKLTADLRPTTTNKLLGLRYFAGNIDGDNHFIDVNPDVTTLPSGNGSRFIYCTVGNVTLKDIKYKTISRPLILFGNYYKANNEHGVIAYDLVFDNVDIVQGSYFYNMGNNSSLYYATGYDKNITFKDCDNYADLSTLTYSSVFIGGYTFIESGYSRGKIIFDNCAYYGKFTGPKCGMLFGNNTNLNALSSSSELKVEVTNCRNEGTIIGTESASLLCPEAATYKDSYYRYNDAFSQGALKNTGSGSCSVSTDKVSASVVGNILTIGTYTDTIKSFVVKLRLYAQSTHNGETLLTTIKEYSGTAEEINNSNIYNYYAYESSKHNMGDIFEVDGTSYYCFKPYSQNGFDWTLESAKRLFAQVYGYDENNYMIASTTLNL